MTQPIASDEARQRTAALLEELWQRNLPLIERRLTVLEHPNVASTKAQCAEAADVAHKLAGSLGMFGYKEGTQIARELETHFESASPDSVRIAALTNKLRSILLPKA